MHHQVSRCCVCLGAQDRTVFLPGILYPLPEVELYLVLLDAEVPVLSCFYTEGEYNNSQSVSYTLGELGARNRYGPRCRPLHMQRRLTILCGMFGQKMARWCLAYCQEQDARDARMAAAVTPLTTRLDMDAGPPRGIQHQVPLSPPAPCSQNYHTCSIFCPLCTGCHPLCILHARGCTAGRHTKQQRRGRMSGLCSRVVCRKFILGHDIVVATASVL